MKRCTFILALVAAAALAAGPALAKGGHSAGHARTAAGHAHHSAPHAAKHSSSHATHKAAPHSTPHAAHKSAPHQSTPHPTHSSVTQPSKPSKPYSPQTSKVHTTVGAGRHYTHYGLRHRYGGRRHYYSRRPVLVNQRPSFVRGPNQNVPANAGPQTVAPWATRISAGRSSGGRGNLIFQVTGDTHPGLFQTVPSVSPSGALSYTPGAGQAGTATITLVLRNDGGVVGHNISSPQTFSITVAAS
ncbi:MAG: hypothetical protein ACYC6M_15625 [Terriglobales bacterium]